MTTLEKLRALLAEVKAGNDGKLPRGYLSAASRFIGCDRKTLYNYLQGSSSRRPNRAIENRVKAFVTRERRRLAPEEEAVAV